MHVTLLVTVIINNMHNRLCTTNLTLFSDLEV